MLIQIYISYYLYVHYLFYLSCLGFPCQLFRSTAETGNLAIYPCHQQFMLYWIYFLKLLKQRRAIIENISSSKSQLIIFNLHLLQSYLRSSSIFIFFTFKVIIDHLQSSSGSKASSAPESSALLDSGCIIGPLSCLGLDRYSSISCCDLGDIPYLPSSEEVELDLLGE